MKLFAFERTWVAAAFDAVLPEGTALPHGIARMDPGRFYDGAVQAAALEQSIGLRVSLWIVALAPLWLLRTPRTIASVGHDDRRRVLESLLASPVYVVRQLVAAFKAMASMLYAQSPAARAAMTAPRRLVADSGLVSLRRGAPLARERGGHDHAAE
jgi:hypothetical protein